MVFAIKIIYTNHGKESWISCYPNYWETASDAEAGCHLDINEAYRLKQKWPDGLTHYYVVEEIKNQ